MRKLTSYAEYKVLAEVDEALFIETKANKRIAHLRSVKYPARTLAADLPDSQNVDDFNLQTHLNNLKATQTQADEFAL